MQCRVCSIECEHNYLLVYLGNGKGVLFCPTCDKKYNQKDALVSPKS